MFVTNDSVLPIGPNFKGQANQEKLFLNMGQTGYPEIAVNKAVPLQAWNGPESSRNLRFPDFMTTAQDGGKVVSLTHRPPLPPGTHFC